MSKKQPMSENAKIGLVIIGVLMAIGMLIGGGTASSSSGTSGGSTPASVQTQIREHDEWCNAAGRQTYDGPEDNQKFADWLVNCKR